MMVLVLMLMIVMVLAIVILEVIIVLIVIPSLVIHISILSVIMIVMTAMIVGLPHAFMTLTMMLLDILSYVVSLPSPLELVLPIIRIPSSPFP